MIVWGSKAEQTQIGSGVFFCPVCRAKTAYSHIQVSRYFTLYFIPLFQTSTLGKYIRCHGCGKELSEAALTVTQEDLDRASRLWACPACNNKNSSADEKCLSCGLVRYSKPPPIPSTMVPPPIPSVRATNLPPAIPPRLTPSTQTPPQPSPKRKSIFNSLTITITAVVFLFVALFIWRIDGILQRQEQSHPPTGAEQFNSASENIHATKGRSASGNSALAIQFASGMTTVMDQIRNTAFEQASEKSLIDERDTFKTYCDLTPGQCVFLVHVPELRRFDSGAQDAIGESAWRTAKVILEEAHLESPNIKLAVGIQGLISYDRVMYGRIQLGITNNSAAPTVERGFGCERALYSWFKPAAGKHLKTNQIKQTTLLQ